MPQNSVGFTPEKTCLGSQLLLCREIHNKPWINKWEPQFITSPDWSWINKWELQSSSWFRVTECFFTAIMGGILFPPQNKNLQFGPHQYLLGSVQPCLISFPTYGVLRDLGRDSPIMYPPQIAPRLILLLFNLLNINLGIGPIGDGLGQDKILQYWARTAQPYMPGTAREIRDNEFLFDTPIWNKAGIQLQMFSGVFYFCSKPTN